MHVEGWAVQLQPGISLHAHLVTLIDLCESKWQITRCCFVSRKLTITTQFL